MVPPRKRKCMYGLSCYRKNPGHLQEYRHPADPDWNASEEEEERKREEGEEGEEGEIDKAFPVLDLPFRDSADYGDGMLARTKYELALCALSRLIREKDRWYEKIKDPTIRAKWQQELKERGVADDVDRYLWAEFDWLSSFASPECAPGAVDGTWVRNAGASDEPLRLLLCEAANKLELAVTADMWHPGSQQQVLDLVHPSMYCLQNGRTPVRGKAFPNKLNAVYKFSTKDEGSVFRSTQYAWLPCDISSSKEDGTVTINSYINNLRPTEHWSLYKSIEKVLTAALPLWENVLNDTLVERKARHTPNMYYNGPSFEGDYDDQDAYDAFREARFSQAAETLELNIPPFSPHPVSTKVALRGRDLQVIVKMANIVLTPDKSKYEGGVWHVEGMLNERIVATALYYYDVENLTESRLAFRVPISEEDIEYEQNEHDLVKLVYGLEDNAPLVQDAGDIVCKQGLVLAWPNTYQHRVLPFELADKTQLGHRKILCFFLVDPARPIVSSKKIPPQQSAWFHAAVRRTGLFARYNLSRELEDLIFSFCDAISHDDALRSRQKLMDERKFLVDKNTEEIFERPLSLCEH